MFTKVKPLALIAFTAFVCACADAGSEIPVERDDTSFDHTIRANEESLSVEAVAVHDRAVDVRLTVNRAGAMEIFGANVETDTGVVHGNLDLRLSPALEHAIVTTVEELPFSPERALLESLIASQANEGDSVVLKRAKRPTCDLTCRLYACLDDCSTRSTEDYCAAWCSCRVLDGKGILQCQRDVHVIDL